jgi:hypothetical protein
MSGGAISSLTIAKTAFSALSAYASYKSQKDAARAQQAQFNQNKLLAQRSMLEQARQLSVRDEQERAAASDKIMTSNIEAAKAKGRMVASAGEAGVAGGSIAQMLNDVERSRLNNEGTINRNLEAVSQQSKVEREGLLSQAEGRINSVSQGQKPSILATGLQIGGTVLENYGSYRTDMANLQPLHTGTKKTT